MVSRELAKIRQLGTERMVQIYDFGIQARYLRWKKDPLHAYLRSILLKGVPDCFTNPNAESVSRTAMYVATEGGAPIYHERVPSTLIPFPVMHFGGSTHFLSKCALEAQGYVDKSFRAPEGPTVPTGFYQHLRTQEWFMANGVAEAMEVPVWKCSDELVTDSQDFSEVTGFIDLFVRIDNRVYICDYKPDASSAKNKHAISQVLKYRDLLHLRTGITDIGCAWFDETDTYIVNI